MVRGNLHRGVRVFKVKLPVLLKAFQSLLTSPEFVQNLKASSSLIMGCPLAVHWLKRQRPLASK